MKTVRPVDRRMGVRIWHADFRAKSFDAIRTLVSGGKGILQFSTAKEAQVKANEIERLVSDKGTARLAAFDQDRVAPAAAISMSSESLSPPESSVHLETAAASNEPGLIEWRTADRCKYIIGRMFLFE